MNSIFEEMVTSAEFQKSMLLDNDDDDCTLREVLDDYPTFNGEIKFDAEDYNIPVKLDPNGRCY